MQLVLSCDGEVMPLGRRSKPTMRDVARRAGVSAAAVSYALSGRGGVGEETRARILRAARELGYSLAPERGSRAEGTRIGVLYPTWYDGVPEHHEVYAGFTQGFQTCLEQRAGCSVTYAPNCPGNFAFEYVAGSDTSGLLFLGVDAGDAAVRAAAQRGLPIVLLNHAGSPGVSSVSVANQKAMCALVGHLVGQHGHRRLAFVQPAHAPSYSQQRLAGCREAMSEHGLPVDGLLVLRYEEDPAEVVEPLVNATPGVSVVVADRDAVATILLDGLRQRGVAVPGQMAVTGFDDLQLAASCEPGLTTIRFDFVQTGERAAALLLELVAGEVTEAHIQLPFELVVRQSCGCQ